MTKRVRAILDGSVVDFRMEGLTADEQVMLLQGGEGVLDVLASNTALTEEVQVALSLQSNVVCVMNLADNPMLIPSVQVSLASHPSRHVRSSLACRKVLDPDALCILLGDTEAAVREEVAQRPDLSDEYQVHLAGDASADVRRALAKGPSRWRGNEEVPTGEDLCGDAQHLLTRDVDTSVRVFLAKRPELTDDVKVILAGDADRMVQRSLVGEHESLPFEAVVKLSAERYLEIEVSIFPLVEANHKWLEHLNAVFVHEYFIEEFFKLTRAADKEVLNGLLPGWEGSVNDLLEACRLVQR